MKRIFVGIGLGLFLFFEGRTIVQKEPVQSSAAPLITVQKEVENDPLPTFDVPHVVFHYYRNDEEYDKYALWLWDDTKDGAEYTFTKTDEYGKYLYVSREELKSSSHINFIIKSKGSWSSQTPDVRIDYDDSNFDSTTNAYHYYLVNNRINYYGSAEDAKANDIYESYFSAKNKFTFVTNNKPTNVILYEDNVNIDETAVNATYSAKTFTYSFTRTVANSAFNPDFARNYEIVVTFEDSKTVRKGLGLDGLYDDAYFIEELAYTGSDLGVTYSKTKSTFKAWAPTVSKLELRIYDKGTPVALNSELGNDEFAKYDFVLGEKGVWTVEVTGDLHGKYYTFVAYHPTGSVELVDPYAKGAGINGVRGLIVDFSQTNPLGWEDVSYSEKKPTEIIPYELHVADLTSDDSWSGDNDNRARFLGLIEEGTTYTKGGVTVKTGFDHIKELGINALQIIPFYDQQNDERNPEFNWGYNPQNYNVLEGSYSSDPYDGLVRIGEFKQVVQAYAKADIRIIMDVVYNHVASLSAHSFSKLVPGYYFRYNADGSPDNSSGVGNVTASERIMMENFMRDSAAFWVEEYKIGGFRFDLMGLHTTDAMNSVKARVSEIRSDVLVFGEPWNMDQTKQKKKLATQANIHLMPAVGAFNDRIRDTFVSNDASPKAGWIQMPAGNVADQGVLKEKLRQGMLGKTHGANTKPTQTINYASAHDNYTLFDKMNLAAAGNFPKAQIGRQALQADSFILLSQGVSFIHAGSEILRSKPLGNGKYDYNSYKSPYTVNSLKWDEKVDNLSIFTEYQKLIAIKKNTKAFQYTTNEEIAENVTFEYGSEFGYNDSVIRLTAKDEDNTYTVIFVGISSRLKMSELKDKHVMVDTSGDLEVNSKIKGEITINSNTTLVLKDKDGSSNLIWIYPTAGGVSLGGVGLGLFFGLRKKKIIV